jgi:hypothetical protein
VQLRRRLADSSSPKPKDNNGKNKDNDKNKEDRRRKRLCRRDTSNCKRKATAYCDSTYAPPLSEDCKTDIFRCCNFYAKCTRNSYRRGNACNDAIPW